MHPSNPCLEVMTSYARLTDADLVGLARDGDRAAFAVLLDRTLPDVWATVSQATDVRRATRATHATYADALHGLDATAGTRDAGAWIGGLAQQHAPSRSRATMPALTLPPALEDEVWRDVERRWPDGRRPRRRLPWRRILTILVLFVAAALVPVAVLGLPDIGARAPAPDSTVEATPVDGPSETEEPVQAGPLPDYTFPTPPSGGEAPVVNADPGPEVETEEPVAPATAPEPGPDPVEPEPTVTQPATTETTAVSPAPDPELEPGPTTTGTQPPPSEEESALPVPDDE